MVTKMENLTSRGNPICVHMKKLGANRSYREQCGQFLCDGEKLLFEALEGGVEIEAVLSVSNLGFDLPSGVRLFSAQKSLIDSISPLKNTSGVLFSCRMPMAEKADVGVGVHVLLDSIQDPGNVGTLIRSAYAFGAGSVMLTEGSADIYNLKTIRASMGTVFHQRVFSVELSELCGFKKSGVKFIGTANDESSVDVRNLSPGDFIFVLGNEGQGISAELLELCDEMIRIPLSAKCESLNVAIAGSIIMWEMSLPAKNP